MSQAEELLMSLANAAEVTGDHIVVGSDRHVSVPRHLQRIAVQYDHDIETVTFDCPRYWDGHDMSKMHIYINYIRSDRGRGMFLAKNVKVDSSDSDIMHFDWTISRNVTLAKGKLRFLVCIKKVENALEVNHWNSELCDEFYISEGLECEDFVEKQEQDIITDLLIRMDGLLEATAPVLDTTLTARGFAADSKAVGDRFERTDISIAEVEESLSRDISAEATTRKTDINALNSRMAAFTALPNGSTTGDAELADARIGATGVRYPTAGEATRDQIADLISTDDSIFSKLGLAKPLPYILANFGNGTDGHIIESPRYRGAFVKVRPGQVLSVSAKGIYDRFSFAFCNAMTNGADSISAAKEQFQTYVERYCEKIVTVPDGYSLMLVTLFISEEHIDEFRCDLNIYDISFERANSAPRIVHPEVTGIGAVGGLLTDNLVRGFFFRAKPNTAYKVTIKGEHNRCYYYGADEVILSKPGTSIENLGFLDSRTFTEVSFRNTTYNFIVFTVAYTGEGFEPNCTIDVYENHDEPVELNGIPINVGSDDVEKPIYVYKAIHDVGNVNTTSEVYSLYDALVNEYPNYVRKNKIGSNSLGADIYEYIFTNGDYNTCTTNQRDRDSVINRPTILVISGVHGYERSAVMSTYQFARDMCAGVGGLENVKERLCIKIVPVVTPYSFDHDSRMNENGVNIARNFNANWVLKGADSQDYSGASVADQRETQAIQAWIESNRHATLLIDHHNSGYEKEVSYIGGKSAVMDDYILKRKYFRAIDGLREYWINDVGFVNSPDLIFDYTGMNGGFGSMATAYNYANKFGIQGICLETSWNQNASFGKHSKKTIGVGAEVLGNIIAQFAY